MFRTALIVPLLLFALSPVHAQLTGTTVFDVSAETTYFDDCDPGTVCFVVWCGTVEGTLTMEYVGFFGGVDNYDVIEVDCTLHRTLCGSTDAFDEPVLGSGTFTINPATLEQEMNLDLTVAGFTIEAGSGLVAPAAAFPMFEDFAVFDPSVAVGFTFVMEPAPVLVSNFTRGDANDDGNFDIADPVLTLTTLFVSGSPTPPCLDALDSNDDGSNDIGDAVYSLAALFSSGPNPPAPFPGCGEDLTVDGIDCDSFASCP